MGFEGIRRRFHKIPYFKTYNTRERTLRWQQKFDSDSEETEYIETEALTVIIPPKQRHEQFSIAKTTGDMGFESEEQSENE